jgi:hypothetical protein
MPESYSASKRCGKNIQFMYSEARDVSGFKDGEGKLRIDTSGGEQHRRPRLT